MESITIDWANMEIQCDYQKNGNEVHLNDIRAVGKWDNFDLLVAFAETDNPLGEISTIISEETAEPYMIDESDISDMEMDERRCAI